MALIGSFLTPFGKILGVYAKITNGTIIVSGPSGHFTFTVEFFLSKLEYLSGTSIPFFSETHVLLVDLTTNILNQAYTFLEQNVAYKGLIADKG